MVRLEAETGKVASAYTYKRDLKKIFYRWKRFRQSSKEYRNEAIFRKSQQVMSWLQVKEDAGEICLHCFDEFGL